MPIASLKIFCSFMEAELSKLGHLLQPISATSVFPTDVSRARSGAPRREEKPLNITIATLQRLSYGVDPVLRQGAENAKGWVRKVDALTPDLWPLDELVKIFSDVFFLDDIRYPVTIRWEIDISNSDDMVYGKSTHLGSGIPGRDHMHIRIDRRDYHEFKGLPNSHCAYLSTIVNQLIHAYLQSHCCAGAHEHGNLSNDQVCRRNGNEDGPPEWYAHHFMSWFFLACRIELCLPGHFGFVGDFFVFHTLVKNFRVHNIRMTAGDWKLFFTHFSWSDACALFGKMDMEEFVELVGFLSEDRLVMQVFADEGLKY